MKHAKEIAIGAVLVVLAGTGLYVMQHDIDATTPPPAAEAPAEAAQSGAEGPDINQQFEDVLNEFLRSINDKAKAYRDERKVLAELVKPENLRDAAYIEQNYQMMKGTVPALRLKIDGLMHVFEETEVKVEGLLKDQPPEMSGAIMAEWQSMKQKQANLYVDFFGVEDEILKVYEDLMTFLYNKKDAFTVDLQAGKLVFMNAEDDLLVKNLRLRLVELAEKESALLESHAGDAPTP